MILDALGDVARVGQMRADEGLSTVPEGKIIVRTENFCRVQQCVLRTN